MTLAWAHTGQSLPGEVFVFGGNSGGGEEAIVTAYDTTADSWTTGLTAVPPGATDATRGATIGTDIYLTDHNNDDAWHAVYDTETDSYDTSLPDVPYSPGGHSDVSDDSERHYAIGGGTDVVYRYDPATGSWTQLTSHPNASVTNTAAIFYDGHIYTAGNFFSNSNTMYAYDVSADSWSQLADIPAGRDNAQIAQDPTADILYLFGGRDAMTDVRAYDIAADSWTAKTDLPTARREGIAVTAADELIYLIGGQSGGGTPVATVTTYDPESDTYDTTSKTDMPTPRYDFAAAAV